MGKRKRERERVSFKGRRKENDERARRG